MTETIHGHEVMKMMIESGATYTRDTLRAAMVERFGEEARYHTCSAQDMTAETLIVFLAERGKFIAGDEGFRTQPDRICNH